jgi:hypothetical protein
MIASFEHSIICDAAAFEGGQLRYRRKLFVTANIGPMMCDGNRSGEEPAARAAVSSKKRRFPMIRMSRAAALTAIGMLVFPAISLAQGGGAGGAGGAAGGASAGTAGGAASGPTAGTGSAVGSPNAGSTGAGTAGVSGVPSGPASAGGLNNSGNDPSGAGNSAKVASPPPPGTNSAGTAQSSGGGVTTGSAAGRTKEDEAIDAEIARVDRKLRSICRGC